MRINFQEGEAPVTPTAPQPKSKKEKKKAEDDDDDGNWTVDVSEEAVRARMQGGEIDTADTLLDAECFSLTDKNDSYGDGITREYRL